MFNGLRYVVKTCAPWRWMPNDLPRWEIAYQQARRWLSAGCFETLAEDLRVIRASRRDGPNSRARPSSTDSRTLRSTPESGARAAYDGAKRKKGSKLHLAVDTLGHLLALHVTPANADDRAEVGRIAKAIQAETGQSVEVAFVDQGYTGQRSAAAAAEHGIALEVVKRPQAKRGFVLSPNDGSSSDPSGGQHGSGGSSKTTSDAPRPSPTSTSSPSSASCSKTPPNLPPVPNSLKRELHGKHFACGTIRLKLLKIAALVRVSARRITFALASACPYADEWRLAAARLA